MGGGWLPSRTEVLMLKGQLSGPPTPTPPHPTRCAFQASHGLSDACLSPRNVNAAVRHVLALCVHLRACTCVYVRVCVCVCGGVRVWGGGASDNDCFVSRCASEIHPFVRPSIHPLIHPSIPPYLLPSGYYSFSRDRRWLSELSGPAGHHGHRFRPPRNVTQSKCNT